MNGGYGIQPNFAVLALLPAPPGMTSLACSKSSRERLAQALYLVSNVTSLPHVPRRQPDRTLYTLHTQFLFTGTG